MKKRTLLLTLTALISGCTATIPMSSTEATNVPGWNHVAFIYPERNTAPVLIIRDRGFAGGWCSTRILVNGLYAARMSPGEKVLLHVPAGEASISAQSAGICDAGWAEQRAVTVPGKPLHFRVTYGASPEILLQPIYAR